MAGGKKGGSSAKGAGSKAYEAIQEEYPGKIPGSKFGEFAKKFSECSSANSGGNLGWFPRGKMVGAFEEKAFNSPIGQLVPPFKSASGYHIILVEGPVPGQFGACGAYELLLRDGILRALGWEFASKKHVCLLGLIKWQLELAACGDCDSLRRLIHHASGRCLNLLDNLDTAGYAAKHHVLAVQPRAGHLRRARNTSQKIGNEKQLGVAKGYVQL
eukprot:IDg7914t1